MRSQIGLGLAAFVVRLAVLAFARATGRFPEFWEYEVIARNLLTGEGFVYHHMGLARWAYVEPLYPFLVAAVYLVTGVSVWALALVQLAVSALLAPVTYALAQRTFGHAAGLAAGALVVVHPALAGYATKFHPLTFDALAIALVALASVGLLRAPSHLNALLLGLAIGACVLTRPTILAFVAMVIAWLGSSRPRRAAFNHLLLAFAVAAAVVAPWTLRNYIRLDSFVVTRSHVGFGFWLGNQPGASGGEGDPADPAGRRSLFDRAAPEFRQRVLAQPDEVAQDRVFRGEAIRYVAEDPGGFIARTAGKLVYFWWFSPYLGKRYGDAEIELYRWYYVVVLGLAVLGLVAWWSSRGTTRGDGVRVVVLLLAAVSLAQALFYVQGRHRLAVEALLIVLSGGGANAIWTRVRRHDRGPASRDPIHPATSGSTA